MDERPFAGFARLDVSDPERVAEYLFWLWNGETHAEMRARWEEERRAREDGKESPDRPLDPEHLTELLWGEQAPRPRMARLLWRLLQADADESRFTVTPEALVEDAVCCTDVLPPIQEQLRSVLASLEERTTQDRLVGQGDWGEAWWLPPEQARFMRQQLRRARPDLLQQPSDYQEALTMWRRHLLGKVVGCLPIPCDGAGRTYVGVPEERAGLGLVYRVYVEAGGNRWPLVNTESCLPDDGLQFAWGGYSGAGPSHLAASIVADAAGGDPILPERLLPGVPLEPVTPAGSSGGVRLSQFRAVPLGARPKPAPRTLLDAFIRDVVASLPPGGFRLDRQQVLDWLARHGVDEPQLDAARREREQRKQQHQRALERFERRWQAAAALPGGQMWAQRFDLVPADFECALYVDLMGHLQRGGYFLPCAFCGQPIACEDSRRHRRQRGRSESGRPIYHPECAAEKSKARKAEWWRRQSQDPEFRAQQRERVQEYRQRYPARHRRTSGRDA